MMPFVPFQFLCSLVYAIQGSAFTDFLIEYRTSLETSSPQATPIHQDDTLIYTIFYFGYFEIFLLMAYVSLGASNFVLVRHF